MKITAREARLILILAGVAILVASYFLAYSSYMEKNEALESTNSELSAQIASLRAKVAQEQEMVDETRELNAETKEIIDLFPSYLKVENEIMNIVNIEDTTDAEVSNLTITDPLEMEIVLDDSEEGTASDTTDEETQLSEASAGILAAEDIGTGVVADTVGLYYMSTTVTYTASYDGMKDMLNYITENHDRWSIGTFSATFDSSTGELTGSMSYYCYFLFGTYKDYEVPTIDGIEHGTSNIFGTVSGGESSESEESTEE